MKRRPPGGKQQSRHCRTPIPRCAWRRCTLPCCCWEPSQTLRRSSGGFSTFWQLVCGVSTGMQRGGLCHQAPRQRYSALKVQRKHTGWVQSHSQSFASHRLSDQEASRVVHPSGEEIVKALSLHSAGTAWRYAVRVLQGTHRLLLAAPSRALRAIIDESTPLQGQVTAATCSWLVASRTWRLSGILYPLQP